MDEAKFQALSEIILPPGSTSTDLQAAIDSADLGDVIIISGDMPYTDMYTVRIEEGKEVTIQSDEGNNWVLTSSTDLSMPHFEVRGSLILQNITLEGGSINGGIYMEKAGSFLTLNKGAVIQNCVGMSGVYAQTECELIMNEGAVIDNCRGGYGAGVYISDGRFTMNGGSIINNRATGNDPGGGVYISNQSTFNMYGGLISGNYSLIWGGGVAVGYLCSFTMSGGIISNNEAEAQYGGGGGGVTVLSDGTFIMSGGSITGNEATVGNGGGIMLLWNSTADISGASYIANNSALNGEGGGIYVDSNAYSNLTTAGETIFSCNVAQAAYNPPEGAAEVYPNIGFASTSVTDHALNNYDINYTGGEPIEVTFHVTYNANGGRGKYVGPEIIPGNTDLVLSAEKTGINHLKYEFIGWNTRPDGSGTSYAPGDAVTLDCSTVLFAQWVNVYTITYRANGGRGGYIDHCREFEVYYTVLSTSQTGISRSGFIFIGWNTQPDGSGVFYAQSQVIAVSSDVMLYAQWIRIPEQKRLCRTPATKCRRVIEGQKLWVDNNNEGDTRPPSVEILLLRDGEVYKRTDVDSAGDGYFGFCCLPVWKNSSQKYIYQIDETAVPGYAKTIEGYNVINTLTP